MSSDSLVSTPPWAAVASVRDRSESRRPDQVVLHDDLADAEWLYGWSLEEVYPTGDSIARYLIGLG